MTDGVRLTGLRETVRSLERAGVEVNDLKDAFAKIGQLVTTRATHAVPRRSGALAASIRPSRTKNKSVVRAGSARVPYAGINNYGASRMRSRTGRWVPGKYPASGFLTDSANQHPEEYLRILRSELDQIIRKYNLG